MWAKSRITRREREIEKCSRVSGGGFNFNRIGRTKAATHSLVAFAIFGVALAPIAFLYSVLILFCFDVNSCYASIVFFAVMASTSPFFLCVVCFRHLISMTQLIHAKYNTQQQEKKEIATVTVIIIIAVRLFSFMSFSFVVAFPLFSNNMENCFSFSFLLEDPLWRNFAAPCALNRPTSMRNFSS